MRSHGTTSTVNHSGYRLKALIGRAWKGHSLKVEGRTNGDLLGKPIERSIIEP